MTITLDNEQIEVEPQAVNGLGLLCRVPPGPHRLASTMLVMEFHASNPLEFWETWGRLGGAGQGLVWESGEPFKAPVQADPEPPKQAGSKKRALPGWLKRLLGWFFEI